MSTSDAAELELGVVGGETPPPAYGAAARPAAESRWRSRERVASRGFLVLRSVPSRGGIIWHPPAYDSGRRENQNEAFAQRFQLKKQLGAETKTGQLCRPSNIQHEETDKAQILRANKQSWDEASRCGDSHVLSQNPIGPRVTSCLYIRLSTNQGPEKPELRLKKNLDSCRHSLTETQWAENENGRSQVSPLETSLKVTSKSALSERILAKKEEEVITATSDQCVTQNFSNGESLQHECNDSHICPCMLKSRTGHISIEEDIKDHTKLEKQIDFGKCSNPTCTMLSSSMVTVLAPHWSGRLRRTKQFDATCNLESPGNLQDMVNTSVHDASQHFQETADRPLTDASQAQLRVPFLATRKNALNWSAKSGPARLDYNSNRKMIHTVSLDTNSGKMDSRLKDAGLFSPVAGTGSSVSSLSVDPNEQRRNSQMGHEGLSPLSSKPTTSSLLLSLRRFNSGGKIPNATFNVTKINTSPADRDGRTHLFQNFHNNNIQDMPKPLLSPSPISDGTNESSPILSPSSSNHRGRTLFETRLLSSLSTSKGTEDVLFTQQPQTTNRAEPNLSSSKQAFLSRESSDSQMNSRGLDKNTNPLSESSVSSTRHSPYNHFPLLKSHSLPRTALTSSSWWKQVTQEDSSLLKLKDRASIADVTNTPNNYKRDLPSPSWMSNKIFSGQIVDDRENNNTTESMRKGNMNLVMKTQRETHNFERRNAEDSPKDEPNWLINQEYDFNLNIRGPQRPHSLPDDLSSSKNGRGAAQTLVTHPKELTKHDLTFTENIMKVQPTLLNPKSTNTLKETGSRSDSNHYTPKTNSIHPFTHKKEPQILTKPSPSFVSSSTLNSQALTSKPNSRPTPIGFERSYSSVSRPLHLKTVTTLVPTVNALSKSNYNPVSTATSVSSSVFCTTGSHLAATTVPNPSSPTPVTPTLASSPNTVTSFLLTPPATPVITSPNYSDTSSPKKERTFSYSQTGDTKKLPAHADGKRARRVTWHDSVNVSSSEPMTAETQEPLISSSTDSGSPKSIKAPFIVSLLRSNSPTKNTYRLCSVSPKTSNTQNVKGERYRSLSSDPADLTSRQREKSQQTLTDTLSSDHDKRNVATPRHERALSVESGIVHCHSSTPLALPPDFSNGYKLRYSTPPYSTLMSTRSLQGETKTMTPRSPLFQQPPQSVYSPCISTHSDPDEVTSQKLQCTTISPSQPLPLSFKAKTASRESSKCGVSDGQTDKLNNNNKHISSKYLNGHISLVNNRVHVSTRSLPGDKADSSPSTFVTETLVYGIKSNPLDPHRTVSKNPTPKQQARSSSASLETSSSQQSHRVQSKETTGHSDRGFSGNNSTESQPTDDERSNRRLKETVVGKSRFFSVESNNEQNPKKNRFAKSVSTLNSNLSRSESDRASKSNNRMDQVLNRLRQTFSTRRSEDDSSFPWKWRRASQTPSLGGSSDTNTASAVKVEGTKSLEKQKKDEGQVLKGNEKETVSENTGTPNRYNLTATSASEKLPHGNKVCIMSKTFPPDTDKDKQNSCQELVLKKQSHLTHSSTAQQLHLYEDNGTNYKQTNQIVSCRDRSPGRTPTPSAAYPSQYRESTSSPRNPFSPFSSLSPFSSIPPPDLPDDVFYSPKLQRRRESSSQCEPGEGISLGGSRKSRASTGTPSPGYDKQCFASSYADLKYGIEPGRSFSVSSVLSSRPSGPGRISTGSRFMSVGDLYESAMTCGSTGKDLDNWSVSPDWDKNYNCPQSNDCWMSYFPGNTGKIRSRSLPRSLTRRLANWTSGVSGSPPGDNTTSKLVHLWGSQVNTGHCTRNTESPPTPPPTPPLSPVSRRMSTPPRHSSPTFSSPSGTPQQADSQSSRGHLPSRGYVSSLSTFEEFSDTNSDTTTDDEYYLETGDEEKETEL